MNTQELDSEFRRFFVALHTERNLGKTGYRLSHKRKLELNVYRIAQKAYATAHGFRKGTQDDIDKAAAAISAITDECFEAK